MKTPEQVAAMLRRLADIIKTEQKNLLHDSAIIAKEERTRGFEGSYGPDGSKWDNLKPSTIRQKKGEHSTQRKERKKPALKMGRAKPSKDPEKPLIDTGIMMTPTVRVVGDEGQVVMAQGRSLPVSSAGSIAHIHNEGLGNNPKREHWGFYKEAIERINKNADLWVKSKVKKAMNG